MDKKNVLLLFGGNSFEHDISIITALTIYNKAAACKYRLLPLYLTKDNEFYLFNSSNFNISVFKDFDKNKKQKFIKVYFKNSNYVYYKQGLFEKKINVESVINCAHGGVGEDGTIIAFFNQIKMPISSGSLLAHSVCMNKLASKYFFDELNLPTIKYFKFTKKEFLENRENVFKKIERLDYPVILKPASLGSSIGINIAKNQEEFVNSALVAIEFDNVILVEKAIINGLREFNIACLKHKEKILISEIEEPKRTEEILSFKDKYIGDCSTSKVNKKCARNKSGAYIDPKVELINLPSTIIKKIRYFAEKLYKELDFIGPVRMDFIMDDKKRIFINEVNSIPGSFAYYLFIPSHFKSMNNFIEAIVEESINQTLCHNMIKREFITKLI